MVNQNHWTFPKEIELEDVPNYIHLFETLKAPSYIEFDLSNTENIHSSFIGFLLYAKNKINLNGGRLAIIPSTNIKKIFKFLDLNDFLLN